ncbi:MAG: terminase large subunit domain-containing protein [Microcoleus sp.]
MQRPKEVEQVQECNLFGGYKPKRGGQEQFWSLIDFETIAPIDPRWVWVRGGIGSGKSHLGSAFACTRAYLDPESRGLITANSYSQLTTSTLIALVEFCRQFNVPISPNRASVEDTARAIAFARMCKIFDAYLLVISAEAFVGATQNSKETGRGLQVRYVWADEYAYAPRTVFETINGRLGRGNGNIKGLGIITSSPNKNNPFNWAYETFVNPDRTLEHQKLFYSFNCLTADNDSLDSDYLTSLEASYTPELAAMELRGEFCIVAEGRICKRFDRDRHTTLQQYDSKQPLHLSCDFNRSPASSLLFQIDGDRIRVLEEFHLEDADTFELGDAIARRIKELNPYSLSIHGDATGNIKTANSQLSNWQIIHNKLSESGWFGIKTKCYKAANPPVIDTINSVNLLLFQDRLVVDPNCKELIKDLEILKFDSNGGIDKKSDAKRSHWFDELRYGVHDEFPLGGNKQIASIPVGAPLSIPAIPNRNQSRRR